MLNILLAALLIVLQPEPTKELLPGLKVAEQLVEFEGEIAVDAHHPETPDVYLEMFITAPDSREHESLVVARIKPSNLHAALLAAGFESGAPLSRDESGKPVKAHGDPLRILVALPPEGEDTPEFIPLTDWVMHIEDQTGITESQQWGGLVFAGSRLSNRGYEADGAGTLVSLTSFGNEVIAPTWTVSHLAEVDEPVWIAHRDRLPKKGQRVIVRIVPEQKADPDAESESHEPERVDIDRDP